MANVKDIRVYNDITREHCMEAGRYVLQAKKRGRFSKDGKFPFEFESKENADGKYTLTLTYDPEFNFEEYAKDKNTLSRNNLQGRFVAIGTRFVGKSEPDANGNQRLSSKFTSLDPNFTSEQISNLTFADENAAYLEDADEQARDCRCACCNVNRMRTNFTILAKVDDDGFTGEYYQVGSSCADKFSGKRSSRELFNAFISNFEKKAGVMKEGRSSDGQTLIKADELMAHALTVSRLNDVRSERDLINKTKEMYYKTDEELSYYTTYMDEYANSRDELNLIANVKSSDGTRFGDVFDKQFSANAIEPLIKDLCSVYKTARARSLYPDDSNVPAGTVTKFTEMQWDIVMADAALRIEKSGMNSDVKKTFVDSGKDVVENTHYRYKGDYISGKPVPSLSDKTLSENMCTKAVCGFDKSGERVYYLGVMDPTGMDGRVCVHVPDTMDDMLAHHKNVGKTVDVHIKNIVDRTKGTSSVSVYTDDGDLYRKYSPSDFSNAAKCYSVANGGRVADRSDDDIGIEHKPASVQLFCAASPDDGRPYYHVGLQDGSDRDSIVFCGMMPREKSDDARFCANHVGRWVEYPVDKLCENIPPALRSKSLRDITPEQLCTKNSAYMSTANTSIKAVRSFDEKGDPAYKFAVIDSNGKADNVVIGTSAADKRAEGDVVWLNVVNSHKTGDDLISVSYDGHNTSVPRSELSRSAAGYGLMTGGQILFTDTPREQYEKHAKKQHVVQDNVQAALTSTQSNTASIRAYCCSIKDKKTNKDIAVYMFGMQNEDGSVCVPCARVYASAIGRTEQSKRDMKKCVSIQLQDGVKLYGKDSDGVNISDKRWTASEIKDMTDRFRTEHDHIYEWPRKNSGSAQNSTRTNSQRQQAEDVVSYGRKVDDDSSGFGSK